MTLYQSKHRVESVRLAGWDYRTPGWYFVTACVRGGASAFGEIADGQMRLSAAGRIADSELCGLPRHYVNVRIDDFIVMPNHVHAIVVIDGEHAYSPHVELPAGIVSQNLALVPPKAGSLSAIIRSYKSGVMRQCHDLGLEDFAWQPRFYEHIVRKSESLEAIREYIENNPANWMHDPDNLKHGS